MVTHGTPLQEKKVLESERIAIKAAGRRNLGEIKLFKTLREQEEESTEAAAVPVFPGPKVVRTLIE